MMKCIVSDSILGDKFLMSVEEGATLMKIMAKARIVSHDYKGGTRGYEYTLKPSKAEMHFTLIPQESVKYPEDLVDLVQVKRDEAGVSFVQPIPAIPDEGVNVE
jgi:hypothetical protein